MKQQNQTESGAKNVNSETNLQIQNLASTERKSPLCFH